MRTALISDIHGHLDDLRAVLRDIEARGCDRVVCLGDLVDGGPHDAEVARLIRDTNILAVRGNHDEACASALPADVREYLLGLPEALVEGDVIHTHISPHPKRQVLRDDFAAWNAFDDTPWRLAFTGHTHVAAVWGRKCAQPISATSYEITLVEPFVLDAGDRYLICPGAVGQTREWCPPRRYAIYDGGVESVTFRAA